MQLEYRAFAAKLVFVPNHPSKETSFVATDFFAAVCVVDFEDAFKWRRR